MSEECTHDCSSCGASCDHNAEAKDLIAPLNKDSAIKHVYRRRVSGKGGVGKSTVTACSGRRPWPSRGKKVGRAGRRHHRPLHPHRLRHAHQRAVGNDEGIDPAVTTGGIKAHVPEPALLENETDPVIWRGSRCIAGVVKQFWSDVRLGRRGLPVRGHAPRTPATCP